MKDEKVKMRDLIPHNLFLLIIRGKAITEENKYRWVSV
jgi:hypothetical protein